MMILADWGFVLQLRYEFTPPHPFAVYNETDEFQLKEQPNRYKVEKYRVPWTTARDLPEYVTFTAHSGLYELPSPELLRAHAAVAGVLHASGMTEVIDDVLSERMMLRFLAEDGSTSISQLLLGVF
jgi:hypothetical protein